MKAWWRIKNPQARGSNPRRSITSKGLKIILINCYRYYIRGSMGTTRVRAEKVVKEAKKEEKKEAKAPIEKKVEISAIIRVAGTDLNGEKKLINAIRGIKGVSHAMARAICTATSFDPNVKLGSLTPQEMEKLESVIKDPLSYGIPTWYVNRRKDPETGKDVYLSGSDLDVARKFDIQKMVDMKSYKGVRHMLGLPVRGQRTRSSFRKGRVVGVVRKAIKIALAKADEEKKK